MTSKNRAEGSLDVISASSDSGVLSDRQVSVRTDLVARKHLEDRRTVHVSSHGLLVQLPATAKGQCRRSSVRFVVCHRRTPVAMTPMRKIRIPIDMLLKAVQPELDPNGYKVLPPLAFELCQLRSDVLRAADDICGIPDQSAEIGFRSLIAETPLESFQPLYHGVVFGYANVLLHYLHTLVKSIVTLSEPFF